MEFPIRINKYLAEMKLASRREADVLIKAKKVLINGTPATLGQKVHAADKVEVSGKSKSYIYLAYYKGRGVITHSPATHEIDIATKIKLDFGLTGVNPIGRLDKDSEGLMILSNDGRLTGPLLDPNQHHEKEYEVMVDKPLTTLFKTLMQTGVDIEGYKTKVATIIPSTRNDKKFNLILTEGKKHQIRRMCAALGYQVKSLKRVRIMNVRLSALKPNQFRKITGSELKNFLLSLHLPVE